MYILSSNSYEFPSATLADDTLDGILAVGGDYAVPRLLKAYTHGIFPWPFDANYPITWFSPKSRFVLMAEDFRLPKSLRRVMKKNLFEYRVDTVFQEVIHECASVVRPGQEGSWITRDLEEGYCNLHRAGFAHSYEAWQDGQLVGGFYGVAIGKCFFGESMFARVADASKCAFATFASQIFERGTPWIDCQVYTKHLARFGAKEVPREKYLTMLSECLSEV